MIYILGFLLWWSIGIFGLVMDWTSQFDMKLSDLLFAVFCGLLVGPVSLLFWAGGSNRIIFKRRK